MTTTAKRVVIEVEEDRGRVTVREKFEHPNRKPLSGGAHTYYSDDWNNLIKPALAKKYELEIIIVTPESSYETSSVSKRPAVDWL
jgi:hypothetical protein